jgi:hypothetical protein
MGLNTQQRQAVVYFTGIEVERTAQYGEPTLFVVGVQPVEEIVAHAQAHNIQHLYFGTSQSYTPAPEWQTMITAVLAQGYWVTLDYDSVYSAEVLAAGFNASERFISMISVKLPNISEYNSNATVKIDDTTWGHSNVGIWCHNLQELQTDATATFWADYGEDTVI